MDLAAEVWAVMRSINRAWTEKDFDAFEEFFREDAVMLMPGFKEKVEGRQPLCDSYRQFAEMSTVYRYEEEEPSIDVIGNVAMVTYGYTIDYELESGRFEEKGRDLFLFIKTDGEWKAAWRTML
ncbi:nuclear transport factor 2 family protein [bacterium]|nr:nuclear transport factor 2 family protein [bacterium]